MIKNRRISAFSLSFLDIMACGFGAVTLLFLMATAMPLAFATWSALLNNFVIERAGFTGVEIGWLHTVREIPGFLAVGVIALIIFMREQVLSLIHI